MYIGLSIAIVLSNVIWTVDVSLADQTDAKKNKNDEQSLTSIFK